MTTEDIYREYVKMQRDIVSGRLICSKEEAATLAAVQLRLETWPEENLELAEGKNIKGNGRDSERHYTPTPDYSCSHSNQYYHK